METPLSPSTPQEIKELAKKRTEGEVLEFPSGFKARLRRPSLTSMIRDEVIPQDLLTVALNIKGGASLSKEDSEKMVSLMEVMAIHAFMEPQLVKDNPTESQISFDDLTDDDRAFVVAYVQAGEAGLKRFRLERA